MAYRNTFFRWLFLYSLTFGLTYVLKLDMGNGCLGKKAAGTGSNPLMEKS